jgi:hypothetical protein
VWPLRCDVHGMRQWRKSFNLLVIQTQTGRYNFTQRVSQRTQSPDVSKRSRVLPDALHPYTFISREEPCCQHGSLQPSCRFSHVANSSEIRTAIQHQSGLPHTTRKSNTTRAYSHYFPTRCSISANMLVSSLFRSINAPRNRNVDFCGWRNAQPLLTARVL